jgi:beta-glucosidase-like glycosyl hydrolase
LWGVVLFSRNFSCGESLRSLISRLRALKEEVSDDPLIVAVDFEGGFVRRFGNALPELPSAFSQGLSGDPERTRALYRRACSGLRDLGFNTNLAPVADVLEETLDGAVGIRSFGSRAGTAAEFAAAALQGIHDAGMLSCVKHFPGLGSARGDSHRELPVAAKTLSALRSSDLVPFQKCLRRGADLVMTAHCVYPGLTEGGLPATLSPSVNRTLLKKEMGFRGIVLTDDLGMDAVASRWPLERAAVLALRGGADRITIAHRMEALPRVFSAIDRAIRDGTLSPGALGETRNRGRRVFERLRAFDRPDASSSDTRERDPVRESRRAFRTEGVLPPEWGERGIEIVFGFPPALEGVEETYAFKDAFMRRLRDRFPGAHALSLDAPKGVRSETDRNRVLLACDLYRDPRAERRLDSVARESGPFDLAVCVKDEGDVRLCRPRVPALLKTFGFPPSAQEALVRLLQAPEPF